MGRIKSTLVKRTSKQLIKEKELFTDQFEHNKRRLGSNTMPSKKMRNKIAGYIAHVVRMENRKALEEKTKKKPTMEELSAQQQ